MSQEAVERFLGRLLTDDTFRRRAARALAQACREEGYSLTGEELRAIRRQDLEALAEVARTLDSSIKRFSCQPGTGGAASEAVPERR
jgi:hypothetical protein